MSYLYGLEKYDSSKRNRFKCPSCNKSKVYTRYVSNATGEYLPMKYGKCDRLNNCGYHISPKQRIVDFVFTTTASKPKPKAEYLNKTDYYRKLYRDFDTNYFVDYLSIQLGVKVGDELTKLFSIGNGAAGATLFPYFDDLGNLQSYKSIKYNLRTGKRIKSIKPFYDSNKNKHPFPLFGSQLLADYPDRPIAIVESEKTAVMMMYYNPGFLWLASGSASMLTPSKLYKLEGRKIILFPDEGEYYSWEKTKYKAIERFNLDIDISKECEIWYKEGQIEKGGDIADYYNNNYSYSHTEQRMMRTKNS